MLDFLPFYIGHCKFSLDLFAQAVSDFYFNLCSLLALFFTHSFALISSFSEYFSYLHNFLTKTFSTLISQLEKSATLFRPKLIVAGASAYARHYDYPRMRQVFSSSALSLSL